ncbi:VRR-NUC domain-containing protein [Halomonas saccharevitans]|uniref:phosphodiesterase I n=1 Tax=Halomonas saccharevitans TaxID=416872 RepID=A0ABU3NHI6_9GAMM|nr:VRR-NUC domain-containing protein [Halomonas saccharevitans]MDT8880639.1 VRR-NUC domain-containing protein [Halomonas saccharevitans]
MNSIPAGAPVTASLDDPRYYLANFRFVLDWVVERHGDLLDAAEHAVVARILALPEASQALLVRMVMRKGEHFRTARLDYPEIGDADAALAPLVETGLVEDDPALDLEMLFQQLRLPELRRALASEIAAAGLPAATGKGALYDALAPRLDAPRRLADWWHGAPDRLVRLTVMATCERLRLMFFGNLRQDWSAFVLAELGLQHHERVAITADSRAFGRREELDAYLALHRLRERLAAGEPVVDLMEALPEPMADNAWLASRHRRLCVALGRQAEREGQGETALALYRRAGWPQTGLETGAEKETLIGPASEPKTGPSAGLKEKAHDGSAEARIRHLRLQERRGEHAAALVLAEPLTASPASEEEAQALERLVPRLCRRLGLAPPTPRPEPDHERWSLTLPPGPVEAAVRDHLHAEAAPVHYVENALLTGLFGLLCWEALFAPLPGAFFHPFHRGPADLYREDFVSRRRERFDACLARLDDGTHRQAILATWRAKQGLASPFVHWGALDEALLEQALACLPPAHLRACFERLLGDLKANRAGLPDLIQFRPEAPAGEPRYRLIEVKGPGDRLQDNQRRWLAFFRAQGMPAVVCHVAWQQTPEALGDG